MSKKIEVVHIGKSFGEIDFEAPIPERLRKTFRSYESLVKEMKEDEKVIVAVWQGTKKSGFFFMGYGEVEVLHIAKSSGAIAFTTPKYLAREF